MDPSDYMTDPRPAKPDQLSTSLPGVSTFVTSHDPETGKSIVQSTREPAWKHLDDKNWATSLIWSNAEHPDLNDEKDIKDHDEAASSGKLGPVMPNGVKATFVDLKPGYKCVMHRTMSVDYGVVLEGQVEMILDDDSVTLMRRGDVAIQRGTMHAWRNPSKEEWSRMLFVLQDIQPLTVNGKELEQEFKR